MKLLLEELLNPRSWAEIAIFTLLFFVILQFMRGTRGAAILKGSIFFAVLTFVVLMWLSEQFKLERLKMLLTWLLTLSGFGLVAVFAPEIRRGLSRLAEGPAVFAGRTREERIVRDIVEASFELAKKRIGALIAIERDIALEDLIESGATRIDAEVTPELLQNLFHPGSPLHDGAVVIRDARVAAAGVVMPLSSNPNIPRDIGTRHRAAIGVTEETDAVAVVVSEETGRVSMCVRGQIHLGKDRTSLQQDLAQHLRRASENGGIRGLIRATRRKFGPWHKHQQDVKNPGEKGKEGGPSAKAQS